MLICGAGQLGSRHLQGLAACRIPLSVQVLDPSPESLARAHERWNEASAATTHGGMHDVRFNTTRDALPEAWDVVIVATTADVRPAIVAEIAERGDVRYWVMEKVLAQSTVDVDRIRSSVARGASAWVNTPRRMMPWHRTIRDHLGLARPIRLQVSGQEWGLACNAVHFLDLCAWWTDSRLESIGTDDLSPRWIAGKRPGFAEVSGTLHARYADGSTAALEVIVAAPPAAPRVLLGADDGTLRWRIDEAAGHAARSDGLELPGRMLFQSGMTGQLVESILESGSCELPSLAESADLHRVFLSAMLEHWKAAGNPDATRLPIT